jgi:hypothetical protein
VIAALVGVYVGGARVRAEYQAYQTMKASVAAAQYLFSATDVKDKDGKPLSRADLLDAVLRDVVARAVQPAPAPTSTPVK